MDEFLIEAVSLKGLQKVRVGHDSSGPGAGWFLDKVVIKDPEDNTKEHVFPCNRFGIITHVQSLYACNGEVQWNLDFMKCQGTKEIGSIYRGFLISRFCSTHFKRPGWRISFFI